MPTEIEYLDYTWNPLAMRCTKVSPACDHCWHLRFANRLSKNPKIPADVRAAYAGGSPPLLVEARLDEPCRVSKPARIGVQFMGDLFHEDVQYSFILDVWRIIHKSPQHTFQILTKRPERMLDFVSHLAIDTRDGKLQLFTTQKPHPSLKFVADNVHLGVTAENQTMADERIPVLLRIPAVVHFVSAEPLLGEIDLSRWIMIGPSDKGIGEGTIKTYCDLDQIIVGAETGPGKRPMKLDWARSFRDQCISAGTSFFFKKGSDGNRELDGRLWEQIPPR